MQQEPSQAKAYYYYEPNYMYISEDYKIELIEAEDTYLYIKFGGTFKYFKEAPIFYDYTEKNIIFELENKYTFYQNITLVSLYDIGNDTLENFNGYYELFKDNKPIDRGDKTLTIITNKTTSEITNWTETKRYELRLKTDIVYLNEEEDKEVINDIVNQTLKNLKIANSKYAQDRIAGYGGISEDYIYKQGYNAGYYAGQLQVNAGSYNEGYAEGFEKGKENGTLTGKIEGYENGYNNGYNEGIKDSDTDYAKGYKEGYDKAIKDANVLPKTIFTTIGSVAGFIGQLGKVEILGISLLDVLAMITIVGVVILITKVAL